MKKSEWHETKVVRTRTEGQRSYNIDEQEQWVNK